MRTSTAILLAATLFSSAAAAADPAEPATNPLPSTPVVQAPAATEKEHEFRLGSTGTAMHTRTEKYVLSQYSLLFTPEYEWRERLVLTALLRMSTASLTMKGPDGMPFDATLSLPWQVSLGAGVRYRVWSHKYVDLSLFGEFEFPLGENEAHIDSFELKGDAAAFVPDTEVLRSHIKVRHLWRRIHVGTTARGHFGRWRPFIEVGYVNGENRITASFDQEATDLFNQANITPKRHYDNDQSSFMYSLGTDVDVGYGIRLKAVATVIPLSDGVFVTGNLGIIVPIDIPTSW